jgi:hypothetical protein
MKFIRGIVYGAAPVAAILLFASSAFGQIVINEVMKEERTASGNVVADDSREFVELYNKGNTTVDLTNWSLVVFDLLAGSPASSYTITSGSIAPGGYFVIGDTGVPGAFTPAGAPTEMFPDLLAQAIELRDGPDPFSANLIDAVAYDVYRAGVTGTTLATPALQAQIGRGYVAIPVSPNAAAAGNRVSFSRYRNGLDTNKNGLDFGNLPITPNASNETGIPQVASHTVPNVDSLTVGANLTTNYYGPFENARVINPTVATANLNPRAIPASPQLGNAIIAWDHTGGGNSVYSKELVNKFEVWAYLDTDQLGVAATTNDREYESSTYGIGSTDPLYENVDLDGTISDVEVGPFTRNGNTGVGWVHSIFETNHPDDSAIADINKLYLVDFGEGGNSQPADPVENSQWKILQTIDMSTKSPNWYRLGIDYNPATDQITARFGEQVFTHTLSYDLIGNFYVGYREGISGAVSANLARHNPPIFDLFSAAPAGVPGDYNNNGKVDAADYVLWRNGGPLQNEVDAPGTVNAADYTEWRARFGNPPGSGSGQLGGAVPEPAAFLLALVGMLFAGLGRRRVEA